MVEPATSSAAAAAATANILTVRGLSRRFGGLQAVNAVDLDLPRGRLLALIGPNGAGKSTTVNLLAGVLAPSSGSIRLGTTELTGLPAHRVARAGLVRTFQNGRLFARLSVLENVLVGADARYHAGFMAAIVRTPAFRAEQRRIRERAMQLLESLGLAADASRAVGELPYGRQRKIEIARALMLEPTVLMLDEPAAGLNSGEVEALIAYVDGLRAGGLSLLLIEHNMGLVMRLADRVAVLNFGQLIASGEPAEVRANEAVIEAYLGRRKTGVGVGVGAGAGPGPGAGARHRVGASVESRGAAGVFVDSHVARPTRVCTQPEAGPAANDSEGPDAPL